MNNKGDEVASDFKSKFLGDAEFMKENLGPALCLAKWKQVSLHLPTGLNNSCYHPPLHKIPVENLAANPGSLHNTPHKKAQRVMMLRNKKPPECEYCWNMEAENKLSDRHYRSGEPWAAVDFEKIQNSTGEESDVIPSYVEVNFNNVCNLMCSYCSPQFSSSWQQEVDRSGGYPTARVHNDPGHFGGDRRVIPAREHNPYVEAFWEWWPKLYPELIHFRMTGGEPLLDKNTYRVFDHVLANPSAKLHLNVTSNFSVDEKSWQKYLGYVKQLCDGRIEHFMQYVSLDGWGTQAEYMRHGLDFDLLWDRVNQFLTEVPSYNSLTFIVTMNNLSVPSLENLFAGILGLRNTYSQTYQRVWFDTPVLREPAWQSLQILPEAYVDRLEHLWAWMIRQSETPEDPFHGFKDYEIARLDRDIAWMRAGQNQDHSQAKADFYRFFQEHDRRRGTDFLKTFPEMKSWWAECAYQARNAQAHL
jgi:hypothetical protein